MNITMRDRASSSAAIAWFAGAALLSCGSTIRAQDLPDGRSPELAAPVPLRTVDGALIESRDFCVPTVADIDGDGRRDLVVGQFMNHRGAWFRKPGESKTTSAGTVKWYRNSAEHGASPKYALGVDLQCDGGLLYAANW